MRSSRFSPLCALPSPAGGFPLRQVLLVAEGATGLPLRSHRNPQSAMQCKQPRSFPRQCWPFSILFCRWAFKRQKVMFLGRGDNDLAPAIPHIHSRQATLHPAPLGPPGPVPTCRFTPSRKAFQPHELGSPRKQGQRPHAIADRPTTLTPCTNPQLGVESQHKGLHRCALNGILSPSSRKPTPTRILRHLSCSINIIPQNLDPFNGSCASVSVGSCQSSIWLTMPGSTWLERLNTSGNAGSKPQRFLDRLLYQTDRAKHASSKNG